MVLEALEGGMRGWTFLCAYKVLLAIILHTLAEVSRSCAMCGDSSEVSMESAPNLWDRGFGLGWAPSPAFLTGRI